MAMPKGIRLLEGHKWSEEFPEFIDCGDGRFRKPRDWFGKQVNHYYTRKSCTSCSKDMLQSVTNAAKSPRSFCSKECHNDYKAANSRGHRCFKQHHDGSQHVLVKMPEHYRANPHTGYVYEHIVVAEEAADRDLEDGEVVHHLNCVKDDNRPSNLLICSDMAEHNRIHGTLNKCVAELLERGLLRFDFENRRYTVAS